MSEDPQNPAESGSGDGSLAGQPPLPPAAQRALAEAEERRRLRNEAPAAREIGGRNGPDPVRYGDWEAGGIVSDF